MIPAYYTLWLKLTKLKGKLFKHDTEPERDSSSIIFIK